VNGLLGKSASLSELRTACLKVLEGGEYWGSHQVTQEMMQQVTPRELEVLRLLVNGKTNQQIAEELSIKDRCKTPNSSLSQKFNILIYKSNSDSYRNRCKIFNPPRFMTFQRSYDCFRLLNVFDNPIHI